MRQRGLFPLLVLICSILAPPVAAAHTEGVEQRIALTQQERDWIAAHPDLAIAVMDAWPPLDFAAPNGEPAGIGVDILRLLIERTGLSARILTGPFHENLAAVRDGRLAALMDVTPRPDREAFLNFTEPYLVVPHVLIGRVDGPYYASEADLAGRTVAIEEGFYSVHHFHDNHPEVTVVEYPDTAACLAAVSRGDADAYAGNRAVATYVIAREVLTNLRIMGQLDRPGSVLAVGTRKDWPELAVILDKALASLSPTETQAILRRWTGEATAETPVVLSDEEQAWLAAHRDIRVGVDPAWLPFEALDKHGGYLGVVSEYVDWLNAELGIAMRPVGGMTWAQVLEKARAGGVDVIPAITPSPQRAQYLHFTRPYLRMPGVLVTREGTPFVAGLTDLAGKRVAVVEGYVTQEYLERDFPEIQIVTCQALRECLAAVAGGRAEAAFDNLGSILYTIRAEELSGLQVAATTTYNFELAFAVRQDWPELVAILDKTLATIPKATRQSFYDRWVNASVQSRVDWGAVWRIALLVGGLAAIVLVVFVRWNRQLAAEIAERKEAEAAALAAEAKFRRLFNVTAIPLCQVDAEGAVQEINPKFTEVFGYRLADIPTLEDWWRQAYPDPADRDRARAAWTTAVRHAAERHGEIESLEYRVACKGGETRSVCISGMAFEDLCLATFVDVTEVRRTEAELQQRIRDLDAAQTQMLAMMRDLDAEKARAEAATQAKSEFLANMSHEIRTPMNAVLGMTHLALGTALTEKQQDYLQKIDTSAKALLHIIDDILDYSKIEAGRLDIEQAELDLEEVLDHLAQLIQPRAEEKDLELLLRIAPDVPLALIGDPLRLGQILINLTTNSVKFTDRGEIVVAVARLAQTHDQVVLEFTVRDTGIGLTDEQCGRLFQSFSQADTSTTRRYGGTGLGLAISKRLAELMGGEIGVESRLGAGSTFWFTARLGLPARAKDPGRTLAGDLAGMPVLVVDDNRTACDILADALTNMGFAPETACSGAEAIERLEAAFDAGRPFKLVLMDWKMPGMDGIEAAQRIRRHGRLPEIPTIVMVTAYGREEVMHRAQGAGLDAFLVKPVNPSVLFDTIVAALGPAAARELRPARAARKTPDGLPGIRGATVLVAEDNEINQQVARELLEEVGLRVDIAADGQQALERVRARRYDAVLMDIQMPVMDGLAAARAIRGLPGGADLPIIAMTAHAMAGDREKTLAAGMNDHITKPVDPVDLFSALVRWIPHGERPADGAPPPRRASRPAADLPELPGYEVDAALARLAGNVRLYRRLLAEFARSHADAADRLRTALDRGQREDAERLAHTLKGVAGSLGHRHLQEAAAALETGLREAASDLGERIRSFALALESAVEAARPLMDSEASAVHDAATASEPARLRAALQALAPEVQARRAKGCREAIAAVRALSWPPPLVDDIQEIARLIGKYRFKEAEPLVAALLVRLDD
ncbi:response regulator [Thiococcus pfennigii]|uniref:response regulator n=1 Tax=Thiococcus pfennigii TaxID=1057 RepID=UPI001904471F|nr:transporter substrate-binding domain-containing protein [Thiococcus pfennigii]MBK1700973.1 hypothetical protein [Thiococcus pfennigii]